MDENWGYPDDKTEASIESSESSLRQDPTWSYPLCALAPWRAQAHCLIPKDGEKMWKKTFW